MKRYDFIIAGSGISGASAARFLADKGFSVLVLEKRDHIGGNVYDFKDEHGITVHKYGPHIFHTNDEKVYEFLSRFTTFTGYEHRVLAKTDYGFFPVPFNFKSIDICFNAERAEKLKAKLEEKFGADRKVPILELRASGDEELSKLGDHIYKTVFEYYTVKQWGLSPCEIDPAIVARVPVFTGYDNRYFTDKYQGMPDVSYTAMIENMLSHENIEVRTGVDAGDEVTLSDGKIYFGGKEFDGGYIYTGQSEKLFGYAYGDLPYRSIDFVTEYLEVDRFQPAATVNYTVSEKFTRITEFKQLTGETANGTVIMKEFSKKYDKSLPEDPCYPVFSDESRAVYAKYENEAKKYKNLYLLGRLAGFRYINMDTAVALAMSLCDELCNKFAYGRIKAEV